MARKPIVKVILSKQQHEILETLTKALGISASEAMRTAFMDYAKSLGVVSSYVNQRRV